VLRHVIEHALLAAHRHVFGVFFWFVVLSALGLGPMGAVLYRMAEFSSRYWGYRQRARWTRRPTMRLLGLSRRLFQWIDHVPARLTAFGFAVVGNFEEAIGSWRRDAAPVAAPQRRRHPGRRGRCGGCATGRRRGTGCHARPVQDLHRRQRRGHHRQAQGSHRRVPAQPGHLQSVVGLVWRSVVLWMLLVALLSLANVLG
jgi:adenosylcobinamide-phosphate synthase